MLKRSAKRKMIRKDVAISNPLALAAANGDAKSVKLILETMGESVTSKQISAAILMAKNRTSKEMLESALAFKDAQVLREFLPPDKPVTKEAVVKLVRDVMENEKIPKEIRNRVRLRALSERVRKAMPVAAEFGVAESDLAADFTFAEPIGNLRESSEYDEGDYTDLTKIISAWPADKISYVNLVILMDMIVQTTFTNSVTELDNWFPNNPEKMPNPLWFVRPSSTFSVQKSMTKNEYTCGVYSEDVKTFKKWKITRKLGEELYSTQINGEIITGLSLQDALLIYFPLDERNAAFSVLRKLDFI